MNLKHLFLLLLCIFGFSCQQRYAHRAKVKMPQKEFQALEQQTTSTNPIDTLSDLNRYGGESLYESSHKQPAKQDSIPQVAKKNAPYAFPTEKDDDSKKASKISRRLKNALPLGTLGLSISPQASTNDWLLIMAMFILIIGIFLVSALGIFGLAIIGFGILSGDIIFAELFILAFLLVAAAFIAPYFIGKHILENKRGIKATDNAFTLYFLLTIVLVLVILFLAYIVEALIFLLAALIIASLLIVLLTKRTKPL